MDATDSARRDEHASILCSFESIWLSLRRKVGKRKKRRHSKHNAVRPRQLLLLSCAGQIARARRNWGRTDFFGHRNHFRDCGVKGCSVPGFLKSEEVSVRIVLVVCMALVALNVGAQSSAK